MSSQCRVRGHAACLRTGGYNKTVSKEDVKQPPALVKVWKTATRREAHCCRFFLRDRTRICIREAWHQEP